MKMARGNKYFQDNYDRKYGIQYMDNLTRHAIKKFFRKYEDFINYHSKNYFKEGRNVNVNGIVFTIRILYSFTFYPLYFS